MSRESMMAKMGLTKEDFEPKKHNPDEPTQLDVIEAQVLYTALMTDTLLEEDITDV